MIRSRTLFGLLLVTCAVAWSQTAVASDIRRLDDVDQGWQVTQSKDRPMLLFVTRGGCKYCVQMERNTYQDDRVAAQVNDSFVPVMIDSAVANRVLKNIEIHAYPTTLVISPDAVLLDRIKGYISPQKMARRLDAAQKKQGAPDRR